MMTTRRDWLRQRLTDCKSAKAGEKMADEIGGYPKGTITWVYLTSDGGLTLENSFLVAAERLPPQRCHRRDRC